MVIDEIQCIFVGQESALYSNVVDELKIQSQEFRFIQVNPDANQIVKALRKQQRASFIFIADTIRYPLEELSDLLWQNASDAIVVILSNKEPSGLSMPYGNSQFFKVEFEKGSEQNRVFLKFLVDLANAKHQFRRCKNLLGISEKKCQWLVDSSREAVAFISGNVHLYANSTYLKLFQFDALQELQAKSVNDLVLKDEHLLFYKYRKAQTQYSKAKSDSSLIVSLQKQNGEIFRANVYALPAVYKGRKCLQLWVQRLHGAFEKISSPSATVQDNTMLEGDENNLDNPFSVLLKEKEVEIKENKVKQGNNKAVSPSALLKTIIKRKEAVISTQAFTRLSQLHSKKTINNTHHLLSLIVPQAQKNGVDDLLAKRGSINSQILQDRFWDKVKMTRILQSIIKKDEINVKLFVLLKTHTLTDPHFFDWLKPGLERLGKKSESLVFILPSTIHSDQRASLLNLVKNLRGFNIKIAQDGFRASKTPIYMLNKIKPEYVRLSLPWVRQIQGDERREVGLSGVIRQLEAKNVKVIAPCGFSSSMRKLFVLSGASFCQERATKSD